MDRRSWLLIVAISIGAIAIALFLTSRNEEPTATAPSTTGAGATTTTTTTISTTQTTAATTLAPGTTVCDAYDEVTVAGVVASDGLTETSGVTASRVAGGVTWAHNDSGDGATLYAVGPTGEDLGAFAVAGAVAFDWEDIASGPGPEVGRSYLYIGDIGDNFDIRDGRITIYRVPDQDPATLTDSLQGSVELKLDFPDGGHDAEAVFITDGFIHVVTKDEAGARVYRAPTSNDDPTVMELVATLDLGAVVTASDVSWDGSTIAFRGYDTVWMWFRDADTSVAEALAVAPCEAPAPDEEQGEALAFRMDGTYSTISEGSNPELHLVGGTP
ncbi:MAG: hypothetical protein BMS9Abin07_2184 [Acidimicrobiia bacterium]|nr:MAG: hypothetical protein BMS9Abin07_2184 [Acidimicrobiia bacterium]